MADQPAEVILGVDTHADVHVAALLDHLGRLQATLKIPTTRAGYQRLLDWAGRHGQLTRAGVEGTGTYGAGLTRFLTGAGVKVIEVDRPNRQRRRRRGKSDPTDAEAAARAVLAGEATATPKTRSGIVEAIRVLRVARTGAIKARTQAANQLRDLLVSAPEALHAELYRLSTAKRVQRLVAQQPAGGADPTAATRRALWHLARRYQTLTAEVAALNTELAALTRRAVPAAAGPLRRGGGDRRPAAGHRRGQPRPAPLRGRPGRFVRRQPRGGVLGQDRPPPAQSWW
jgi:transposase